MKKPIVQLTINGANNANTLSHVAKWLKKTAATLEKNSKKQFKTGEVIYSKRYTARYY